MRRKCYFLKDSFHHMLAGKSIVLSLFNNSSMAQERIIKMTTISGHEFILYPLFFFLRN